MAKINIANIVKQTTKQGVRDAERIVKNAGKNIKIVPKNISTPAEQVVIKKVSKPKLTSKQQNSPKIKSLEVQVKAVPASRTYGVLKFKNDRAGGEHYLVDTEGQIFDHYNGKWVENESLLGPTNENAQIYWQYGENTPWQGNLQAIRNRLLRRGTQRGENRYATVGEDGKLSVYENAAKRLNLFNQEVPVLGVEPNEVRVLGVEPSRAKVLYFSETPRNLQRMAELAELAERNYFSHNQLAEADYARQLQELEYLNQELENLAYLAPELIGINYFDW